MSNHQNANMGIRARQDPVAFRELSPRASRLAIGLSAALLGHACWPIAASAAPQGWAVTNCNDSGPGSLRDIVQNQAHSGDIVNLSQLPGLCGMDPSTITLSTAEIVVAQDGLTLLGPLDGTVKISGGGTKRVLHHTGAGTLSVESLTIVDGYDHAAGNTYGGCIESDNGNVYLNRVLVQNCIVLSDTGVAAGGGVDALHDVGLVLSTISGNQAIAPSRTGWGGGINSHQGSTTAKYSMITENAEHDAPGSYGYGGGISTGGGVALFGSTMDGNTGAIGSGIASWSTVTIINSTISGNIASAHSALAVYNTDSATIANSTIAFNHDNVVSQPGAVFFWGASATSKLTLQSSILADNTSGPGNLPRDLNVYLGALDPAGADNLVIHSNVIPPPPGVITVADDPMLGPLQLNGGSTPTHMLLPGSPALSKGNNNAQRPQDQRGLGYPRTTGTTVDIGAVQFDTIFVSDFDFIF